MSGYTATAWRPRIKIPALPFTVTDWGRVPATEHPGESGRAKVAAFVEGVTSTKGRARSHGEPDHSAGRRPAGVRDSSRQGSAASAMADSVRSRPAPMGSVATGEPSSGPFHPYWPLHGDPACGHSRASLEAEPTGGHLDVQNQIMSRKPQELAESTKRPPTIRVPRRLLAHVRRWHEQDSSLGFVIRWQGEPIQKERRAWERARDAAGLGSDVTPHVLRHTCATWLMQRAVPKWEAAGFLGMSLKTLEEVYGHHPDHQKAAVNAF